MRLRRMYLIPLRGLAVRPFMAEMIYRESTHSHLFTSGHWATISVPALPQIQFQFRFPVKVQHQRPALLAMILADVLEHLIERHSSPLALTGFRFRPSAHR